MDLDEITRQIRVRIGDEQEPYVYSTNLIWGWINTAYMTIQLESDQWMFHHERSDFITTVSGTADYTSALVKYLDKQSLYYIEDGTTARQPLIMKTYQDWEYEQRSSELSPGPPQWLIKNPDQTWKVDPEPDGIYVIYADRWLRPTEMAVGTDVPLWEAEYHKVILYEALAIAISLKPEAVLSQAAATEIGRFLPPLRKALTSRHLPSIGRAGAML